MSPKDIPYPFYDIPDENYFGEFRELSNSIGNFEKNDKEKISHNHKEQPDNTSNDFSTFPIN